jgi:hypothetical protein
LDFDTIGAASSLISTFAIYFYLVDMPFAVVKVKGGYKVKNMDSGKYYSLKPLTKEMAHRQLVALLIHSPY